MKYFFVLVVFFFLNFSGYSQEPLDSLFVVISDDTVHIWNTGAYENCGCLFRMDVGLSNDTIYVTEVDTTSDWAYCYCNFDLCASVTGLQSGNYFVEVFRYMPLFYPDTVFYIGSTSFIYGGSSSTFVSNSFQSDCYEITSVNEKEKLPGEFELRQNYPNPFNPTTNIGFRIANFGFVSLKVYDVLGREVATLVNEEKMAGKYELEFNGHSGEGQNLSSGVYFYQLKSGSLIQTKKMLLLK